MPLMIKEPSVKLVPVEVINLKWVGTVSPRLEKLKCSACHKAVGFKPVAIAWIKDDKGNRSLRLCEDCGKTAERKEGEDVRLY